MNHVRKPRAALGGAVAMIAIALLATGLALSQRPAEAANQSVDIVNSAVTSGAYQPPSVTVNVGEMVTWANTDTENHTATSNTGAFDTGEIAPAGTDSVTFNTAGTFPYHCSIHPTMLGTVIVQQVTPTTTTTATTTSTTTTTTTVTATTTATATPTATPTATVTATATTATATATPTRTPTTAPTSTPTTIPATSTPTTVPVTTAAPGPPATGGGTVTGTGAGTLMVLAGLGAISVMGGALIAIRRRA